MANNRHLAIKVSRKRKTNQQLQLMKLKRKLNLVVEMHKKDQRMIYPHLTMVPSLIKLE